MVMKQDDRRYLEEIYTEERDEDVNENTETVSCTARLVDQQGIRKVTNIIKLLGNSTSLPIIAINEKRPQISNQKNRSA